MELRGDTWPEDEELKFKNDIRSQYEHQGHPYYSAARIWDDGILDPSESRMAVALGISASFNAEPQDTKFGIFRM